MSKRTKKENALLRLREMNKLSITPYYALKNAAGETVICNGTGEYASTVSINDEVLETILQTGTLSSSNLYRRWVLSQMFRMLLTEQEKGISFDEQVSKKGPDYQMKILRREVECRLVNHGNSYYAVRCNKFNTAFISGIIRRFANHVISVIDTLPRHKCKGREYVRLRKDIFVDEIQSKLTDKLLNLADETLNTTTDMTEIFYRFHKLYKQYRPKDTPVFMSFIDAYKAVGAYESLRNLILFHDCTLRLPDGTELTPEASLDYLEKTAMSYCFADTLYDMLKNCLQYNHIDIRAKMKEWSETKKARLKEKREREEESEA